MSVLSVPTFTNLGYWWHARSFQPLQADLSGRTVVATGASGGLGLEAARQLAGLGARVAIVARNQDKLDAAVAGIEGEAVSYRADLSLLAEIRSLAEGLLEREGRIDVLINNVGVLLPERQITSEGLEKTMATNLAGHFLLTHLLTPRLVESAPARIVNVTSGGMYAERIRPDDLHFERGRYRGTVAYARAKRGQVILTEMWAERLAPHGVVVHAMHPGWAETGGVAGALPTFDRLMGPLLRSAQQGADTMVWLAADPAPAASNGKLWFDRRQVPTHLVSSTRESPEEREALWKELVALTGQDLDLSGVGS
ncbi:MAG: SDR family NAD(P)-dependent oxidoreductase [Actinomycetota bacterium]